MKLLPAPKFPPWIGCDKCGEPLAARINGVTWCTSAACDPRGLTLRALQRYFEKHPAPTAQRRQQP